MTELFTTFAVLRDSVPDDAGNFARLSQALGGVNTYGLHRPIPYSLVLEHTDFDYATRAGATCGPPGASTKMLLSMACDFVEGRLDLFEAQNPGNTIPRDCLAVFRRRIDGKASDEEHDAALLKLNEVTRLAWLAADREEVVAPTSGIPTLLEGMKALAMPPGGALHVASMCTATAVAQQAAWEAVKEEHERVFDETLRAEYERQIAIMRQYLGVE